MMLRNIIGTILIFVSFFCKAQAGYQDSLLLLEEKIFNSKDAIAAEQLLASKINLHLQHSSFTEAFSQVKRYSSLAYAKVNADHLWNNCLLALQFNNPLLAERFFKEYNDISDSSSAQTNFLGFLTYMLSDSAKASAFLGKLNINDSILSANCIYSVSSEKMKSFLPYGIASYLLPGSGLIALGKPVKGLVSLAIATSFVLVGVSTYNAGLIINTIGWGILWGSKFYFGQAALAEKEFFKKQSERQNVTSEKCRQKFLTLMHKYKIEYRLQ